MKRNLNGILTVLGWTGLLTIISIYTMMIIFMMFIIMYCPNVISCVVIFGLSIGIPSFICGYNIGKENK
jgi:hypothetical protein